MNINPIASYNKNNNQPSFQAVNMKYLERAKKEIANRRGDITDNLLYCITYDVFFKTISAQDGIDTLKAIKSLLKNRDRSWQNWINELIGTCKQIEKQARIEQRREAKKTKSCQ